MSDPMSKKTKFLFMRGELGDKIRIQHVLDAISEIESYLNGVPYEDLFGIPKSGSLLSNK